MEGPTELVICKGCGVKLRVPSKQGMLAVTCPRCAHQFVYNSGPPQERCPAAPPAPPPSPGHAEGGGAPSRRRLRLHYLSGDTGVTLRRMGGFLAKSAPLKIIVDGYQIAEMINHQDTDITVSTGAHTICMASLGSPAAIARSAAASGSAIQIPAGPEEYLILVQKEGNTCYLRAALQRDPFLEGLQNHFRRLCAGQGLLERLRMRQNRNRSLYLAFRPEYFSLSWDLVSPRGVQQWATGTDEERIAYASLGLQPPSIQPGGYWDYLRIKISALIDASELLQCSQSGVITERRLRRLF